MTISAWYTAALFLLIILIVMLATKKGREALFEMILGGIFGGDSG